ncbi:hypothetical protein EXE48_05880 [Halorubrum sp. ASP1]|jgi:hypothetical protein|uniref:Flagella cluster protein n=1 Tax=Halorubrum tropicale TaxID=1765655 RepID=A0A0N0BS54_9EURY|nr:MULTISPECIES: hypothetical protein [Halorubrum]KOX97766.1 hypothetical protein AMR74_02385 [Halorubrum tropicale]TKX62193.1 hypothetical protein EXE48_05880 [Halorubrum sp. ASP1]
MSDHDPPANDPDAVPADPEELDFTDDENVVEIGEGRYVVGTNGRPNVGRSRGQRRAPPEDDSGFTAADPASPDERRPAGDDPRASAAGPGVGERGQPPGGQAGAGHPSGGQQSGGQPAGGGQPPPNAQGHPRAQTAAGAGAVDRQSVSRWLANSFDGDGFDYGIDATLHAKGDTTRQRTVSNDVTATFDTLISWFASNAGPSSPTPEAIGLLLAASETTVDIPPVMIKRFAASQGLTASDSIGDLVRAAEEEGGFRLE